MKSQLLHGFRLGGVAACALLVASTAVAADRTAGRELGAAGPAIESLKLDTPVSVNASQVLPHLGAIDPSLIGATGRQQVIVRLKSGATTTLGADAFAADRMSRKQSLEAEQSGFIARCQAAADVRVLGRVQHVLNAVFLDVPASEIPAIAADADVTRVAPVGHYRVLLEETVPYIGAAAAQAAGLTGKGVSVAVLDSGVDYTHADLGGSGDPADYANNDGNIIEPGTFPTAKVVGGFDFLGNQWPTGPGGNADPPVPDPDPIDDLALIPGAFAGHGTHVADIIAGVNGVAPEADIYAVKVCASLTPACNGISLILGMDFAVDPNGDGDTSDRVDIINMSLGADYGQPFDDDLVAAVENASALGTLTVSSAGNCGDLPYCTGTPSSAPSAIAVAQTNVPSAIQFLMNILTPAIGLVDAVKYSWTPDPDGLIEGVVQYGDRDSNGDPINLDGCAAFESDVSGQIVAVDRGGCFFSDKVRNIEQAGGIVGIVMLIDGSAPFNGAFGGGDPITIPGFNVSNAVGDVLRSNTALVQFGPDLSLPLVGVTVSSTARGPDLSFNAIKPEIGAPGASISALVGTGTEREPFGGTSGASPMVAGAAALVLENCRDERRKRKHYGWGWYYSDYYWGKRGKRCTPARVKAQLVNTGFRDILSDTTFELAEITRIGGGEVRADAAAETPLIAYERRSKQPVLSLGFSDVTEATRIKKRVKIENLSKRWQRVEVTPTFRFDGDAASGAISVSVKRDRLWIPPRSSRSVKVTFDVDPAALTGNPMNSGSNGNVSQSLTAAEYDGYLLINSHRGDEIAVPWHILPRQAAAVEPDATSFEAGGGLINLANTGAGIAQNDTYALLAVSENIPRGGAGEQSPTPDLRAVGINTFPVPPGFCSADASFLWAFAINTWERQTHLVPVSHQILLDTNQDGVSDYLVLNRDVTLNNVTDGRQLSYVVDLASGEAGAFFFAEHATNTGNTMLLVCAEQLGLSGADILATNVNIDAVLATDFYFGGPGDVIPGPITVTPLGERFLGVTTDVAAGDTGTLEILDFGSFPGNSPELGIMLWTNGDRGDGARGGATQATEALLFGVGGDVFAPEAPPAGDDDEDDDDDDDDDDDEDDD